MSGYIESTKIVPILWLLVAVTVTMTTFIAELNVWPLLPLSFPFYHANPMVIVLNWGISVYPKSHSNPWLQTQNIGKNADFKKGE